MFLRPLLLALLLCVAAGAQTRLSIPRLKSFIESSVKLQNPDKQVAEYLRTVKLTNQLDEDTLSELRALHLGPKTREALAALAEASKSLPKVAPPPPPPPPVVIPPPPEEEQKKALDDAREYAQNYTKRLPDFICSQITRRYRDPTGMGFYSPQDTIIERLTFFEQKEKYELVMVNNRAAQGFDHEKLGGATSRGEFGSMMHEIFEPQSDASFNWERWARLRNRRMEVYSYRVAQTRSKWQIGYQHEHDHQEIVAGYRGSIFVDAATHVVMRIVLEAEDIPASFPIREAGTMLDYDFQKIGGSEHVLPLRVVMHMREGKDMMKNEAEFRLYRKFGAEATIKFEEPPPLTDEKTKEQPIK